MKRQAGVSVYVEETEEAVAGYDMIKINTLRSDVLRVLQALRRKSFRILPPIARIERKTGKGVRQKGLVGTCLSQQPALQP